MLVPLLCQGGEPPGDKEKTWTIKPRSLGKCLQMQKSIHRKANGFQMVPSCALNLMTAGQISPSAYATLAAIISFVGADRTTYVYRRTIAARTGQSVATVARHLVELAEAGLLQVTTDPYRGPSVYAVLDPCGECFAPSPQRYDVESPVIGGRITGDTHKKGPISLELNPIPKEVLQTIEEEDTEDEELDPAVEAEVDRLITAECEKGERRAGLPTLGLFRDEMLADRGLRAQHRADITGGTG